jgi:Co/Zn/Cd efflux system component
MYPGYWQVNDELLNTDLNRLADEGLIKYSDVCEITWKGPDALSKKERDIEEYYEKRLSKEACTRYSLFRNVGLSALEFVVGFPSGSIGLIADAIHTAVDIVASGVTWIGTNVDKETGAALISGIILCGIGLFIAFESP